MKKYYHLIFVVCLCCSDVLGHTPDEPNEGLKISRDPVAYPTLPFEVVWWARPNFYYFVLQTSDLTKSWSYHDFAVKGVAGTSGQGAVEGFRFDSASTMLFFKIEFTDDPNAEVLLADFDGDFVSNKDELDMGTDLFDLLFSDPDLMADEWELFHFGDLDEVDSGNPDGDFTTNLEESELGLDPNLDERGLALTYTYDSAGRLTAVSGNSTTATYTLDEEGNITSGN